jgi:hypothetical protein
MFVGLFFHESPYTWEVIVVFFGTAISGIASCFIRQNEKAKDSENEDLESADAGVWTFGGMKTLVYVLCTVIFLIALVWTLLSA